MEIQKLAEYCLNCPTKPCVSACPLNNNIPEFIKCVKENNIKRAYEVLCETTVMPSVCGRICPHEKQCEGNCVRRFKGKPVEIGKIEAFIGDYGIKHGIELSNCMSRFPHSLKSTKLSTSTLAKGAIPPQTSQKSVAIIGSGPAGLTAAAFLANRGHSVTILEQNDYLGGLLKHGIPSFRLDRKILDSTIQNILSLGINVCLNKKLGKDIFLEELTKTFDYVILGFGANSSIKAQIPGEELDGVFGANELLEFKLHPNYEDKDVIVVGGGNVAMDVARSVNKMGAKRVTVAYRRGIENMPAERKEVEMARKRRY